MAAAERFDECWNRWFLDPVFGRGYPADMVAWYGAHMPTIAPADLATIAAPIDVVGINYYRPTVAQAVDPAVEPLGFRSLPVAELATRGYELTEMGWPVVPAALTAILSRVQRDYAPAAIYITENGAAIADQVVDGVVSDGRRVSYLHGHLAAAHAAIEAGVALRGYFVWSLLDNFEWVLGYSRRFGVVHVDFATLVRTPKASAAWYQQVIAANGVAEP